MDWLNEFRRRLWMLMRRRQFGVDLEDEMRLHLELRAQELVRAGLSPEDARYAALRRFGNTTLLKEKSHMAWGWEWLEHLVQDMNYGVRAMLRSPGITIVALLSLALGIGANTAIFNLIDAVMLRALPVQEPGRLLLFGDASDCCVSDYFPNQVLYSYPFYREMQQKNQVFSQVAAVFSMMNRVHGSVEGRSETEPMNVQLVSGTYFPMLGVQAIAGRILTDDDDRMRDGNPVAVVSYSWWTRSLARDSSVLNKKLNIGLTVFSIVGVAPKEFFGTKVGESPDIWIPLSMQKEVLPNVDGYNDNFSESLYLMGRLKPGGVTTAQAAANVNLLFQQILRGFPGAPLSQENLEKLAKTRVELTPMATGLSELRRQFSEPLKILMTVVGFVLMIACANIANLLLARSTARARELAVRQALGAGRTRLIRQLLTESLVLAFAGGVLGVSLAAGASRLLLRIVSGGPEAVPLDVSMNIRLLLFTLGLTLVTGSLFGTIPALRATRLQLAGSLKEGRGPVTAGARYPLAKALVVSQIALSLVLLVGAGLFLHSLMNLINVDTGFNREHVLRLQTDASSVGYKEDDYHLTRLYAQIEEAVSAIPGVRAASYSLFTYNEGSWNNPVSVPGYVSADSHRDVHHNVVGTDYFATMGIPLLEGRGFGPQDTANSPRVAVIDETMAHTMFPKGSPIGRSYSRGGDRDIEVIGIVKDVKVNSLQEDPQPIDYYPYAQHPRYLNDFEVRYSGDLDAVAAAVRLRIHEVDPHLPISNVTTLDEQVERSIGNQRLVAQLSTFFGLLAVFLSCIGIYGVMSYVVTRRTNEIGIRMALGARRSHMLWMVLREILILVTSGLVIGVPAALAADRLVSNMLFGLKPIDPVTLVGATVVLLMVAAIAGYLPARRASLVDPMVALRYE
jgi:predicted permease